MTIQIVSMQVGKPQVMAYKSERIMTGIFKTKATTPALDLTLTGFIGDGQADLKHHGGPDKAICVYAEEHYPHWEQELGVPLPCGAFGENLTIRGLTEEEVCIGDIFAIGEVRLQVSQPRQPCHKLAKRHNRPDLVLLVQQTGFTGFYFRVLEPGLFDSRLPFTLVERHPAGMTVTQANRIYYSKGDLVGIRTLHAIPELSASWKATLESRLEV